MSEANFVENGRGEDSMYKRMMRSSIFLIILSMLLWGTAVSAGATSNYWLHSVESGQSLWNISNEYNVSIQDILAINDIGDANDIWIGQQIKIPLLNQIVHTVKSGDTLWKIANHYDVSLQDMITLNKTDLEKHIHIGQQLLIPKAEKAAPKQLENNIKEDVKVHIVVSGDTVWKLSMHYKVNTKAILEANDLTETSMIYLGQQLVIPKEQAQGEPDDKSTPKDNEQPKEPYVTYTTHTVKSGDNVWNLSIQYGIPMTDLLAENNITLDTILYIGQTLKIPVHHIPVMETPGDRYGELLDWWTQAQYVFPIGAKAKVIDFETGRSFNVVRSYGAFHADCEPITAEDAQVMYEMWGNQWSWRERAAIVEYNGRRIAASMSNMPHDIQSINNNNFNGHFDIHFLNSTRHLDNQVTENHQRQVRIAAGVE